VAIKIAITLELMDEASRDQVLKDLRIALARQKVAPKWKVKVSYEDGNEGFGDEMPLNLRALGVEDDEDREAELRPLPMDQYLNSLNREGA
jgi:hypothetical protein